MTQWREELRKTHDSVACTVNFYEYRRALLRRFDENVEADRKKVPHRRRGFVETYRSEIFEQGRSCVGEEEV